MTLFPARWSEPDQLPGLDAELPELTPGRWRMLFRPDVDEEALRSRFAHKKRLIIRHYGLTAGLPLGGCIAVYWTEG
jgi:hypothetical protein